MSGSTVLSNFIWRFLERWGAQGVSLILSIVLARILDPDAYGIVATVAIMSSFLEYFIDGGLSGALIQKKDADDLDFSSVFYANIVICTFLYLLVFFFAPLFSSLYKNSGLTPMIRVQAITLLISGVKSVQISYISKRMQFKKFFFATLGGTIGSAVIGIVLALRGFGAWALIVQNLFNNAVDTIVLWAAVKWRPKRVFSWTRVKKLLSFGWKLLVYNVANKGYVELKQLLIGRVYTTTDLAFYNKGLKFPKLIHDNTDTAMGNVLFPLMANTQNDRDKLKQTVKRINTLTVYVVSPLVIGLGVCAKPIVTLLLTEKWLPCVPYMQVFCISYAFGGIYISNENVIKALGKGKQLLQIQFTSIIIKIIATIIAIRISVFALAVSSPILIIISHFLICWPNRKLIHYSYFEQIRDILPYLLLSAIMGVCVFCLSFLRLNTLLMLALQVGTGIAIYIGLSVLLKPEPFRYLLDAINNYMTSRKNQKSNTTDGAE